MFLTGLTQGLGNGCIGISIKNLDLDGTNADVWGSIDLTINETQLFVANSFIFPPFIG